MPAPPIFIGIDPTAGRRPMHYAAIGPDLRLVAQRAGTLDDALAYVLQHPAVWVAVDAPQAPNAGLMAQPQWRERFGLPLDSRTWTRYRACEYELRRRGILLYNTPGTVEAAPGWMRTGFRLFDRLREAGFAPFPAGEDAPRQMLEVYPHGCFAALLGLLPFHKATLEGRVQRQLALYREGLDVPDAMRVFEEITRHHMLSGQLALDGLYSHDQLDALVAAYTAYLAALRPEAVTPVGDPTEGQIVLPVAPVRERYS